MFLFLHVPKTAGTTFTSILARNYRHRYVPLYEPTQHDFLTESQVLAATALYPEAICLASHHFARPLPTHTATGQPLELLTFVRHPVNRILSLYHYQRREANRGIHRHLAHLPFDDYFEQTRQRDLERTGNAFSHMSNLQTRMLGLDGVSGERAAELLRTAFLFVGVSERFDESLLIWRKILQNRGLSFDPHYRSRKVGGQRDARAVLPAASYQRVENANQLDLQLHATANRLLDEAIARYGPTFPADLNRFRHEQCAWQRRAALAEFCDRAARVPQKFVRRVWSRYL